MSKNVKEIPLTEIVERAIELARLREEVRSKVPGIVNDIYLRDIPKKEDWTFLLSTTSLTVTPEYKTGTVTANTGDTSVVFTGATITSDMTGRRLKISNNDYIYRTTFSNGTALAIAPALSGTQNVSGEAFSLFQNIYPLVSDFDRFPKNGGIHIFRGGQRQRIEEKAYDYFTENANYTPNDNTEFCRITGTDTAGNRLMELIPPPQNTISVEYDYFRQLRPLRETTSGLISSVIAAGTAILGDANTRFLDANTGDYFRIDAFGKGADSEWYRIIAIQDNSSMSIQSAFGNSGAASASYTISSVPEMPVMLHPAILYGTIAQIAADQNDSFVQGYMTEYAVILSDAKRVYKTRIYRQDMDTIATDYRYRL